MASGWIDSHAHVFDPALATAPDARYRPGYSATITQYLSMLEALGADRGVLVQPSFLGSDNGYLLDALAHAPERLRGVIVVDTGNLTHELSPSRVAILDAQGIRGVRLNLLGRPVPALASPAWRSAARTLAERGWHLEVQAVGEQWDALAAPLSQWPGAVVIDHLGLPRAEHPGSLDAVSDLAGRAHVWTKASAPYRSDAGMATAVLKSLADSSPERLIFGTDWPHTQHESEQAADGVAWIRAALSPEQAHAVMATNPAALFGWSAQ